MPSKGGFLIPTPLGIEVNFGRLTCCLGYESRKKIHDYFAKFGYAEAQNIQYDRAEDGLYVLQDLPEHGFARAVDADEIVAAIPF